MIEWDYYWTIKKTSIHSVYDKIAVFYRQNIIKPHLERFISKYLERNSIVLHAGCGGGQVEEEIVHFYTIVGMDISPIALALYKKCHKDPNLIRGNIISIGIKDGSFDGIYNLGVMEHFSEEEIKIILMEFHRILKKGGRLILFWPPEYGSTVIFFKIVHFILNPILRRNIYFQPPEPSRVQSKKWVENILLQSDFILEEISFGLEDFYTNMVVVARKSDDGRS